MRQLAAVLFVVLTFASPPGAAAQVAPPQLSLLMLRLYGPNGLIVDSLSRLPDGSTHSAHFNGAFQSEFGQFNVALASRLANVSLPSPASGFTYTFDPALGVFQRSTQSFGPILADRAETIGKGKFAFGFNYQRFAFDSFDGVDLDAVPAVFTHDDFQLGGGRSDVVTTVNSVKASVSQFNTFLSYGLGERIDASLAIPLVEASLDIRSDASIQRIGTGANLTTHFFSGPGGTIASERSFATSGTASGVGDVTLRLKGHAPKNGPTSLSLAVDVRFPTGDEMNLLGSGAWGVKPLLIASWGLGKVSPHLNLGYQWNGKSVLAGDVSTGAKADVPDQFLYRAGLDVGLGKNVTLLADVLGQRVVGGSQLTSQPFVAANGASFQQIAFTHGSFNETNAAVGLKVSAGGNLLLETNLTFKLDDAGLRDELVPLVGFEYSF